MATPGFLEDGIDFESLVKHYLANNCSTIRITNHAEINLVITLMKHIIATSYEYQDEDSFAKTVHGRFQMIFNSTLQELFVRERGKLIKKSGAVWLLDGHYEKGTDFKTKANVGIETKVYKDKTSMEAYAKKGSTEYTVFHGAEYVLCYLINSYENKHWHWLRKIDGVYTRYHNEELEAITSECLPAAIPVCYCKLTDDTLIIGKNKFCK